VQGVLNGRFITPTAFSPGKWESFGLLQKAHTRAHAQRRGCAWESKLLGTGGSKEGNSLRENRTLLRESSPGSPPEDLRAQGFGIEACDIEETRARRLHHHHAPRTAEEHIPRAAAEEERHRTRGNALRPVSRNCE
jgi:hypothetical protein